MRVKHLNRYVLELIGRRESRPFELLEQAHDCVLGMVGKRPECRDLVGA